MKTRANLMWRHFGVHTTDRTVDLEGSPAQLAADETRLIGLLPHGFLRHPVERTLLVVDGTAVSDTTRFRRWGKYFDAYALHLEPLS